MPVFVVNTTEWLMYVTIFLILMSLGIALTRLKVFSLSNALISSFMNDNCPKVLFFPNFYI